MNNNIQIGIIGYGNLGRGSEVAISRNPDMEVIGVFTRRDPASITPLLETTKVYPLAELAEFKDHIDVLILCGGSATDLPQMTPKLAKHFTVVDSYDNHSKMAEHFAAVDQSARAGGHIAIIAAGWDPGLFSLNRALAQAVLPEGKTYTFWGEGLSQGHSDAVRRLDGVLDARQYTVPVEAALAGVRAGELPELSPRQQHRRIVYVVAAPGADLAKIEREIVTMPAYYEPYDTTVHFIDATTMTAQHAGMAHAGMVFRSGRTGLSQEHAHLIEYQLKLDSNPEFTASVLVAYARGAHRMASAGQVGCKTVFDVAPADLVAISPEQMRTSWL